MSCERLPSPRAGVVHPLLRGREGGDGGRRGKEVLRGPSPSLLRHTKGSSVALVLYLMQPLRAHNRAGTLERVADTAQRAHALNLSPPSLPPPLFYRPFAHPLLSHRPASLTARTFPTSFPGFPHLQCNAPAGAGDGRENGKPPTDAPRAWPVRGGQPRTKSNFFCSAGALIFSLAWERRASAGDRQGNFLTDHPRPADAGWRDLSNFLETQIENKLRQPESVAGTAPNNSLRERPRCAPGVYHPAAVTRAST